MRGDLPEIVDISLPAQGTFRSLVVVSIRKTYPMHGLWGMG